MASPKIIQYEEKYRLHLAALLQEMSKELFGTGMVNVDKFIKNHWVIYLLLADDKVVGLSSWNINDYFGLRTPTVGNTYLYVTPEHRNSKSSYILTASLFCKVSAETKMPLEVYIASDYSRKVLESRLQGTHSYDVYEYTPEQVKVGFDGLKYKKYT
jgi:hypothetical protein